MSALSVLAAPEVPRLRLGDGFEAVVQWVKDNLRAPLALFGDFVNWVDSLVSQFLLTPSVVAFAIVAGLVGLLLTRPLRWNGVIAGAASAAGAGVVGWVALLTGVPGEFLMIPAFVALAVAVRGWKLGVLTLVGFLLIASLEQWDNAMKSLSLVLLAGVLAIGIGIPIGVAAGIYPGFKRIVDPILDFMQTMPAFVYLIPAIALFSIGSTPAVVATIVFSMPPGIRLAALGIRQVDKEVVEAGEAFGASSWKILRSVQLPLAFPTIMAGVNQVIMLALSMVVIGGMVGAEGLGSEVVGAVTNVQEGLGFEAGLAVVVVAIYLDRLTSGLASRSAVVRAQEAAAQ